MPPATPGTSRTRDALAAPDLVLDETFEKFSDTYNLLLRIPAKGLSPLKSRELADEDERIYYRFRYHYYRDNLERIFETYRERAISDCKGWVRNPRVGRGVVPLITGVPRAASSAERDELRRLLVSVLDEFNPKSPASALKPISEFGQGTHSFEDRLEPSHPPAKPSPKRHRDDLPQYSLKKARSFASAASTASHSFSTLSKNSAVFSQNDAVQSASQLTQTTVEASSQEKARQQLQLRRSRRDSPSPTPSEIDAFEESHGLLEENHDLQDNVRRFLDRSSPTLAYSDFGGLPAVDEAPASPKNIGTGDGTATQGKTSAADSKLEGRLQASWPRIPPSLALAPFAVLWEVVRVLLHCKADIAAFDLPYEDSWNDQDHLWRVLRKHAELGEKTLPEKSTASAWRAALDDDFYLNDETVVLTMSLSFTSSNTGPFFQLELHPLQFDKSYRLSRRFGPDRFLQVIVPSLEPQNIPSLKHRSGTLIAQLRRWLLTERHPLFGRVWTPFSIRPFEDRPAKKSGSRDDWKVPEPRKINKNRLYLFAEDGDDFRNSLLRPLPPSNEKPVGRHTRMTVAQLIGWLLQPSDNADQPALKLFSRISLGLSRTIPAAILRKDQIRIMGHDIRSPKGNIMNDGIGRMSPALALMIRNALHLDETPAGFQGRIGSAKGFWIRDVYDRSDDIWIELYPSQRKWNCNLDDRDHRTFEVSSYSKKLEPASLNAQFLPILEDRMPTQRAKRALHDYIGKLLRSTLNEDMESHRAALHDPVALWAWVDKGSTSRRLERMRDDEVPHLGSLPRSEEDRIQSLVSAGFDPLRQRFLWDSTWRLCRDKCEDLKKRVHIKVGRSVFAYMVIDFEGILAENEVHLGFSSNFSDPVSGWSDTLLHGMDVLVARAPAHFVSDIQRVKAVFKPELASLKDVIVFPRNGDVALADKLSGGDYDGDRAWVCWDQDIVRDFVSAAVPQMPDLFEEGYLSRHTETYQDIINTQGDQALQVLLERGLDFNAQPGLLGMCTNFKEAVCYHRKSISDPIATLQSTLLSSLVDQAKQGIIFTSKDFARFKRDVLGRKPEPDSPLYRKDTWTGKGQPRHILDHLKFSVMIPAVDEELARLSRSNDDTKPEYWDKDLVLLFDEFDEMRRKGNTRVAHGMQVLTSDLQYFHEQQRGMTSRDDVTFEAKVSLLYETFRAIKPKGFSGTIVRLLTMSHPGSNQYTNWDLLKASTYFKLYYQVPFIWYVIGSQLEEIKAKVVPRGRTQQVVPWLYAALKADPKYARTRTSTGEGLEDSLATDDDD